MGRVVVVEHVTLDSVMQAPARPDEDRRGGFEHGGWASPYGDEVMGSIMGERMAQGGALLLGRRPCRLRRRVAQPDGQSFHRSARQPSEVRPPR